MAKKISVSSAKKAKKNSPAPAGGLPGMAFASATPGQNPPGGDFAAAARAQAAGRLDEALALLNKVLRADPRNADAMLCTAMTYYLKKDFPAAREWLEKAHAARVDDGSYYLNLGLVNDAEGKFDAAVQCHRRAVELLPNQQQGHYNLGLTLAKMARHAEAAEAFAAARRLAPRDQDILRHLAEALLAAGRDREALPLFNEYISRETDKCAAWTALADIQNKQGNLAGASEGYEKALAANPQAHNTHYHYACMLREAKQVAAALPHFRAAYEMMPKNLGYLCDYSYAVSLSGDFAAACELAEKAIALAPESHHPYFLKGYLWIRRNCDTSVTAFEKALQLSPDSAKDAYGLMALAQHFAGRVRDAEANYKKSLELNPNNPDTYMNYGNTLMVQARLPECLENLAQTIRLRPQHHYALSNVLLYSHYIPQATREYFWELFQDYDRRFALPLRPAELRFANPKTPERKLRVGFVSCDFRTHSVAFFVEPLLRSHDREKFEFFCYSSSQTKDKYTGLLQGYVENWRDILALSDAEAAELIRRDGIDILIDLGGHTSDHRLLIFARKPAPVQVSWLGFPDTTGITAIDYRLSDTLADPPVFDKYSAEKVVRLPGGFHCYCPFPNAPAIVPLPQENTGHVTFGSFNNYAKTSTEIASLWVEILNRVPGSMLMLKSLGLADEQVRAAVRERFSRLGLDPDRLIICPRTVSIYDHLAMYNQVDIALDTWPYNGTTTTFEALWMGAPLMTLTGDTHASRVGASLLANCGLQDLICQSPEEYVRKTVAFAEQPEALRRARTLMRVRLLHSPLLSEEWFTRKFEAAVRGMWREYCGENGAVETALRNLPEFVPHVVMPGAAEESARRANTPASEVTRPAENPPAPQNNGANDTATADSGLDAFKVDF